MYNNAGSSIIISEIGAVNSFYDLDKTDAYQLIGSNYAQIVVDEFYRQTILGCDAVVIEFSYENSGETYYSVYYLIKYEDFCINAVIQSPKHDLCDKLNDIFGDAVIKFN